MESSFQLLHDATQLVIDLIYRKKFADAIEALTNAENLLEDTIDRTSDTEKLKELGRFHVLLIRLKEKIHQQ